jgi:hypothetical protein
MVLEKKVWRSSVQGTRTEAVLERVIGDISKKGRTRRLSHQLSAQRVDRSYSAMSFPTLNFMERHDMWQYCASGRPCQSRSNPKKR